MKKYTPTHSPAMDKSTKGETCKFDFSNQHKNAAGIAHNKLMIIFLYGKLTLINLLTKY